MEGYIEGLTKLNRDWRNRLIKLAGIRNLYKLKIRNNFRTLLSPPLPHHHQTMYYVAATHLCKRILISS